jgi:hypothetical protein
MKLRNLAPLLMLLVSSPAAAQENFQSLVEIAGWSAYMVGAGPNQTACGIMHHHPETNRTFILRANRASPEFVGMALDRPTWDIPPDAKIPIALSFDGRRGWNFEAVGDGSTLSFGFRRAQLAAFEQEFRDSDTMMLSFDAGTEAPWILPLPEILIISFVFRDCMTTMHSTRPLGVPAQPTQPHAPTTPAPPVRRPAQRT